MSTGSDHTASAPELVSVILPTHNRPDRLLGALDSVLAQSHRTLEVLVVDDGSEEPAARIIEQRGEVDDRVHLFRLDPARGAAGARNSGLEHATGRFIAFLDDDDRWAPHKVARQLAALHANPSVGLATCHYGIDYEADDHSVSKSAVFRGPNSFTPEQVQWANFPGSFSFVMARRDLLGDELRIDESFPDVEDWDLWLRCARRASAVVVDDVLVRQTFHTGPRLSSLAVTHQGLQLYLDKHAASLPAPCRAYIQAHIDMERGTGWSKRRNIVRSLSTSSARASLVLATEQLARQVGRLRNDPGLENRVLATMVGRDGRGPGRGRRKTP